MGTLDHAFFYNSENSDRVYDASSFEYWLKKFFTTGVFTGDLQVTANGNMTVSVGTGYANVEGKVKFIETAATFTLATADATYGRIDNVVLERNDTDRDVTLKIVTGGYSSTPVATGPVRSNGIYQLVLAHVSVAAGATSIIQANITDTRSDTTLCGIVAGTVNEMDFSQFAAQFESYYSTFTTDNAAAFNTWFQSMKDQLSTDAAGHLQNEITAEATTRAAADYTRYNATFAAASFETVTVTKSDGTTTVTEYKCTVSVSGITATTLLTDLEYRPVGVPDTDETTKGIYGTIVSYESGAGTVSVYMSATPSADIILWFKGRETA